MGMELAARAGYDPRAGVTLWQKMGAASKGAPPQFLSTHPSGADAHQGHRGQPAQGEGLYERAPRPERRFEPPPAQGAATPNADGPTSRWRHGGACFSLLSNALIHQNGDDTTATSDQHERAHRR